MRGNKKYKITYFLFLIFIIMLLSFIGIGYAYWNENLKISASVKTAYMNVYFDETISNPNITYTKDNKVSTSKESNVANLNFKMNKGDSYKEFDFKVINGGSIPIRWKTVEIPKDANENGISIIVSRPINKTYETGEISKTTLKFIPNWDVIGDLDEYEFKVKMPYRQWTYAKNASVGDEGWVQYVVVNVKIDFIHN
ncbi:hypothetical protein [Clostridium prolinivorans]|uniref:hypothetical protein n=1 Tax=Clostridium prolinivorans TaxID=2769420 RepID=UPI000FD9DC32|nr:hypothetical protein [Clostridium prolinivorans]